MTQVGQISSIENVCWNRATLAEEKARGSAKPGVKPAMVGADQLSAGKVVYQNAVMQLIQYEPTTTGPEAPAADRAALDQQVLHPRSQSGEVIRQMGGGPGSDGFHPLLGQPRQELAHKSFEDYMREGILEALAAVQQATGERGINALGYCVGGTLLAATLAYMAATRDSRVKSATFLTTQVDFSHAGDLKIFMDEEQVAAIERDMARHGYLESHKMAAAFNLLRSNDLIWPYVVDVYMNGKTPLPFDLLYWNSDSTRMPAANHSFYLRRCYINNDLSQGRIEMGGVTLDLSKVTIPVYHLAAREDHIAPARSVFLGAQVLGGPVRFVVSGSGHIAGVVNPPARNRYQHWTGGSPVGELETWLEDAEEHPGSWWPDWQAWTEAQDRKRVPAREVGGGKLTPIEDAPEAMFASKAEL